MSNVFENRNTWVTVPFVTITDLSAKQHHLVKLTGVLTVGAMAAVTDLPIAVVKDKPVGATGVPVAGEFVVKGLVKLIAGAAITAGARIQGDAAGKAITAAATGYAIGRALTLASNAGDEITALVDVTTPQLMP